MIDSSPEKTWAFPCFLHFNRQNPLRIHTTPACNSCGMLRPWVLVPGSASWSRQLRNSLGEMQVVSLEMLEIFRFEEFVCLAAFRNVPESNETKRKRLRGGEDVIGFGVERFGVWWRLVSRNGAGIRQRSGTRLVRKRWYAAWEKRQTFFFLALGTNFFPEVYDYPKSKRMQIRWGQQGPKICTALGEQTVSPIPGCEGTDTFPINWALRLRKRHGPKHRRKLHENHGASKPTRPTPPSCWVSCWMVGLYLTHKKNGCQLTFLGRGHVEL